MEKLKLEQKQKEIENERKKNEEIQKQVDKMNEELKNLKLNQNQIANHRPVETRQAEPYSNGYYSQGLWLQFAEFSFFETDLWTMRL